MNLSLPLHNSLHRAQTLHPSSSSPSPRLSLDLGRLITRCRPLQARHHHSSSQSSYISSSSAASHLTVVHQHRPLPRLSSRGNNPQASACAAVVQSAMPFTYSLPSPPLPAKQRPFGFLCHPLSTTLAAPFRSLSPTCEPPLLPSSPALVDRGCNCHCHRHFGSSGRETEGAEREWLLGAETWS